MIWNPNHPGKQKTFSLNVFSEATEEEAQEMTPVLLNGSPKLPRLPMPSALDHESFDITLHRRDNEGFGFVILTSKSKPPYGGETLPCLQRATLKHHQKSDYRNAEVHKKKNAG